MKNGETQVSFKYGRDDFISLSLTLEFENRMNSGAWRCSARLYLTKAPSKASSQTAHGVADFCLSALGRYESRTTKSSLKLG